MAKQAHTSESLVPIETDLVPEISCRIMSFLVTLYKERFGEKRLEEAYSRVNTQIPISYLLDQKNFVSLDFLIRLTNSVYPELLADNPNFSQYAGKRSISPKELGFVYYIFKAIASPRLAYLKTVSIAPSYNSVGKVSIDRINNYSVVLRYRSSKPEPANRYICSYRMWQYASLPLIWGYPATARELQCQCLGADACVYEITWRPSLKLILPTLCGILAAMVVTGWLQLVTELPLVSGSIGVIVGLLTGVTLALKQRLSLQQELVEEQGQSQQQALHELKERFTEIQELNDTLEARVKERTSELTSAQEKLSLALKQALELDRAKTAFFNNISHEFRTPITLILGPLEDLIKVTQDQEQKELLELCRRNTMRLLKLVNDLLDIARIEANSAPMHQEPTNLSALTEDLASMFRSAVNSAGLQFVVECTPSPSQVYFDREVWSKIVSNLISNALKFTARGKIELKLQEDEEQIHLIVSDTGVGIPTEELDHIFDRFYRVEKVSGQAIEGAGIGLSLVKELVNLQHGKIEVESRLNEGTKFTIHFPRHVAPENELEPLKKSLSAELETSLVIHPKMPQNIIPQAIIPKLGKIMVVDDNSDMLTYLTRILGERYVVQTASNGLEALQIIPSNTPDLILTDVMMPGLDGLGFLKQLRSDKKTSSIPVILMSARTGEEATIEGLDKGADDYLTKPFSANELLARVNTHLELFQERKRTMENEIKENFLLMISHELRTPLTTLALGLSLIQRQEDEEKKKKTFENLNRALERLETTTLDLIGAFRFGSGHAQIEAEPNDLVKICREEVEKMTWTTQREVKFETTQASVFVNVDPKGITHALSNLISNSIKFSPGESPVEVKLDTSDTEVTISIKDYGPGIPPQYTKRIFERFYQVPEIKVLFGSRAGFGLGLFIVKHIVEQHNGRIILDTTPGKGSTFSIILPK